MNEAELLEKARAGDRAAFDQLVAPLRDPVSRFVEFMVSNEKDDIVQEAITRAFSQLDTFSGKSKFSTWLYGIALNICRRLRRDRARHAKSVDQEIMQAQASPKGRRHGVLSSVMRNEMVEKMQMAIDRLPESMKEAFVLRFIDHLDYDEIGEITEIPAGTARVRAHRARALLKSDLGGVVDTIWIQDDKS